ncbi:MAG: hypothetical protein EHM20_16330 [Alphaproteobacteria bacterium]|nr:MAG: hypothetical protein EHM20_16330 [Alphaproteobacteria bacterium]
MKPRTVEDYYVSTGVVKYFLSDIPAWASFNQKAGCFRNKNIRYFNIEALMKSYGLSYNQALQLQASFNEGLSEFIAGLDQGRSQTLKEEELLFYKVSEKISSKIIFFDPPVFERVNFVWLDEVLGDEKKEKKLKDFLNSSTMDLGVPVLVSFCMTRDEVEKKFPDLNTKMITAELFSIYDSKGKATPGFKFEVDQFFKPEQKLYFYTQKNLVPSDEFQGTFKALNY